jgi:hypothetical protein
VPAELREGLALDAAELPEAIAGLPSTVGEIPHEPAGIARFLTVVSGIVSRFVHDGLP